MTTTIGIAFNKMKALNIPVTADELFKYLPPGHKKSTLKRGLRRWRKLGWVESRRSRGQVVWERKRAVAAKVQPSPRQSGMVHSFASLYGPTTPQGRNPMCRPTDKPTLVKAIEDQVAEFVKAEKAFSAHDVTTALREKVNAGSTTIDTTETGTVYVAGNEVAKIGHEVVREAVHDIFHSSEMQGYNREHNGSHWEYRYGPMTVDDSLPPDDSDDDSVSPPDTTYDGSSTL